MAAAGSVLVVVAGVVLDVIVDGTEGVVDLVSADSERHAVAISPTTSNVTNMDRNRITATYRSGSPILNRPRLQPSNLWLLPAARRGELAHHLADSR
jgi:hypothetical protein